MNSILENSSSYAKKIREADARLFKLEKSIAEIGLPAGQDLRRRLNTLRIEENALKRNFEESRQRGESDGLRMGKIEALLHHIECEESSLEHATDFLHQAAPSSVTLAVETGAQVVDFLGRKVRRVLGDHHPLGTSVFVNHTHENLAAEYGLAGDHGSLPKSANSQ